MSNTTPIDFTVLDPDTYKQSLIDYLQTQPQYSGYNFEGANWSVLLDVLKRNTYLYAFYNNMLFNERWLKSAQLRDSIIASVYPLNYIPTSMASSEALINVNINAPGMTSFIIPFGTRFNGVNSNGSYVFTTFDTISQTSSSGVFNFSNVAIYEGSFTTDIFNIDNSIENQIFVLSNPGIDTSSISVQVTENNGSNTNIFTQATTIYNISNTSLVYYLEGASNNQYQILFGDGVLGYSPQNGAIVNATYRVTVGPDADGISNFGILDNLGTFNGGSINNYSITSTNPSSGGGLIESIESIRFNAPRSIQAQERAVTETDYRTLILKNFTSVKDVNVYGGGVTANAVLYGTILIAGVSKNGGPLTQVTKNNILNYLAPLKSINPFTNMVDPTFLYVDVTSNVHVDFSLTAQTVLWYKQQVSNAIATYSNNNLEVFNTPLKYSKLCEAIDNVDPIAIEDNETTLVLKKAVYIPLNTNTNINLSFGNPINSIISDYFIVNGSTSYISDTLPGYTSSGQLYLIQFNSSNTIITTTPIGSVNYSNGNIMATLSISNYISNNSGIYIYGVPFNQNIYPLSTDIIEIDCINGLSINISNN